MSTTTIATENFNPRTPRGVRRYPTSPRRISCTDFNPRTPRGVRLAQPRRGGTDRDFNPRTPRGVRPGPLLRVHREGLFQSTHPARGATWRCWRGWDDAGNFNPRTPRGVRRSDALEAIADYFISIHAPREGCDVCKRLVLDRNPISIHAPREGCDATPEKELPAAGPFQSTHPARGATHSWSYQVHH